MNPYETDLPGEINDTIPCEDYWDQDFINEAELDIVVNNEDGTAKVVDSVSEQEKYLDTPMMNNSENI